MHKKYLVEPVPVSIPGDSASLARGEHLKLLCTECHGEKLEGKAFFDDPALGVIYTPNLTTGKGGIGTSYTDKDWVRSIRNGIAPDGRGLFVMPSKDFYHLSEADLGSLIAYLKTIPPVDNGGGETNLKLFGKILLGAGAFGDAVAAEVIDHKAGFAASHPVPGTTVEYGKYMVDISGCRSCHGKELNGMKTGDPNSPPGANLTPGGNLRKWSQEDFDKTLRTGVTPEGKTLDNKYMPWKAFKDITDEELTAIFLYLKAQPELESGIK